MSIYNRIEEGLKPLLTREPPDGLYFGGRPQRQNIADALFAIATAMDRIGAALEDLTETHASVKVGQALDGLASLPDIASAITDHATDSD
jgi:hypothetical protein